MKPPFSANGRCMQCGNEWFNFYFEDEEQTRFDARFCIDEYGVITGWYGWPYCADCGEKWQEGPYLRLVRSEPS